jgi:sigma-B regulation protein RsbU (phosphoserine phosphatase)
MPSPPSSKGPDPGTDPLVEESLEDLYEHAPCGYISARRDGTIIKVNRTFLTWTGYRAEDLVGQRQLQGLLTPGGRIFYETHYAPLLQMQGSVREIAVDLVCADGRTLPVLMNSVLRTDESGAPPISRTTIFDATERRSYEQELLRAKRAAEESEARARLLAGALQQSFIPPAPPIVPGLDVAGAYRPAGRGDQVGGDFYDVFETGKDDWAVFVGDVCGKGPEAAAVTALARYTLRAAAMRTRRPKQILATLNEALLQQHAERFCTVVYARIRCVRNRWQVTVSSGGHPLPLHLTAAGSAPVGRPGALLGVLDSPVLYDVSFELHPEEKLVFFTDGVIEARAGRDFYGEECLVKLLTASPSATAAQTATAIEADVVAFQNGFPCDDIAIVVVHAPPGPETRPGETGVVVTPAP